MKVKINKDKFQDINRIDAEKKLINLLSEELAKSIDEEIIETLIFEELKSKYLSLKRENSINQILDLMEIDIREELMKNGLATNGNIDRMIKKLEEYYNNLD